MPGCGLDAGNVGPVVVATRAHEVHAACSRPVAGDFGHGVTFNSDPLGTVIHDAAGGYVTSVFDIVGDA